jgi:HYDIN/CFA65/VesB family protein
MQQDLVSSRDAAASRASTGPSSPASSGWPSQLPSSVRPSSQLPSSQRSSSQRAPALAAVSLVLLVLIGCKLDERIFVDRDAGRGPGGVRGPGEETPDAAGLVEGPQLVVARRSLDFGAAVTGFAALARVVVENGGNAPIGAPAFTLAEGSDPDFSIAQDQCGRALAGGERCDVRLQLVPSKPGPVLGTLQIQSDPGGSASVALTGEGLLPGDIVLAPVPGGASDYGDALLETSVDGLFRVTNPLATPSGTLQASLAGEGFVLLPPADGQCAFGTISLEGGQSCDVAVAFRPSVRGPSEGTLSVTSLDIGSASLALRGQGRAPGALGVSPAKVDFSGIVLGKAGSAQLSVFNAGDEPVTIAGASIEGEAVDAFTIAGTECAAGTVLEGGDRRSSCAIDLAFQPTAAAVAAATLRVTATSGADAVALETVVPVAGEGLLPGALSITPSGDLPVGEDGAVDLGDIVIGESRVQAFQVSNGGAEPSGAITLAASSGLTLAPAGAEGDCQSGVTALVDGQSCTVSLQIEPTERAPLSGSLTVTSELVGSASLALRGRGIATGLLELGADDVDFGRVVRGATAPATLTLRNGGDQPLAPPSVAVGAATSGSAAAFTLANGCVEALAPGAECSIELTFAPTAAGAHSATLQVGDGSTVLLRGQGLEPGSLALAAAGGGSAAFGDVARGTTVEKSFTVSNEGGVASGALSITTTSNQFVPDQGDCNAPGSGGLVDGSSCTFVVRFTPTTSSPVTATLNIDSPGAGAASLALSGRGRNPPALAGAGSMDFGVVIVGERSAARLWTVTNGGDLPSAALITTGASEEILVSNDGCAGEALPAGGECSLQVTFSPQQAGPRAGTLTVREAGADGSSVALGVSGAGQALPAVGQPCQDGRCAGDASCEIHSDGQTQVCCGAECPNSQRCDAAQEFTACTLPVAEAGQACGPAILCEAGFSCQPPAPSGRCCPESCTGPCQVCGADGSCNRRADGEVGGCGTGQSCQGGACTDIPSPAALSADPTRLAFGPIVVGGASMQQPFAVTNVGERATGALTVAVSSSAFLPTGDCPETALGPGVSCTLTMAFQPLGPGEAAATVTVSDGAASVQMSVSGTGVCPGGQVPDAAGGCVDVLGEGEPCDADLQCGSGVCTPFFRDVDGDGFGSGAAVRLCGAAPPSLEFSSRGDDCCDLVADPPGDPSLTTDPQFVNPGITTPDSRRATQCTLPFDFDCDGVEVPNDLPVPFEACNAECIVSPGARRNLGAGDPACGEEFGLVVCGFDASGVCGELGTLLDFQRCL